MLRLNSTSLPIFALVGGLIEVKEKVNERKMFNLMFNVMSVTDTVCSKFVVVKFLFQSTYVDKVTPCNSSCSSQCCLQILVVKGLENQFYLGLTMRDGVCHEFLPTSDQFQLFHRSDRCICVFVWALLTGLERACLC